MAAISRLGRVSVTGVSIVKLQLAQTEQNWLARLEFVLALLVK